MPMALDNQLLAYQWILFAFAVAVAVIATIALFASKKVNVPLLFSLIVLLLGMVYMFIIPPFSVPDEPTHYRTSYTLSNAILSREDEGAVPPDGFTGLNTSVAYQKVLDGLRSEDGPAYINAGGNNIGFLTVQYIPQALGLSLARVLSLNPMLTFLTGRLANLLFYALCVFLAIKLTPRFALPMGLVSILPISLQQAASFSYDGYLNGLFLIALAISFKAIYEDGPIKGSSIFAVVAVAALLAPAKAVYSIVLLFLFLIPSSRFRSRRVKVILCVLICLAAFAGACWTYRGYIISIVSGSHEAAGRYYPISSFWENPAGTALVFANTVKEYGILWLIDAFGSALSTLTLVIPHALAFGIILVVFASALRTPDDSPVGAANRVAFFAVIAAVLFATMVIMFLEWTPNGYPTIEGIQGRYFTPLIPLGCAAINNRKLCIRNDIDRYLITAMLLMQCCVIEYVLRYTLAH